jgi:predicted ATPase with chaperone activity
MSAILASSSISFGDAPGLPHGLLHKWANNLLDSLVSQAIRSHAFRHVPERLAQFSRGATVADFDHSERVGAKHLAGTVQYRNLNSKL